MEIKDTLSDKLNELKKKNEVIKEETDKGENPEEVKPEITEKKEEVKAEETKAFFERVKKHNIEVNSDDEVELLIVNSNKKLSEMQGKEAEYQKQIDEYKAYKEAYETGFDPLDYFSSEQAFKKEQLRKNFKDISDDVAEQIIFGDPSKMSPKELLVLDMRIANPTLSKKAIDLLYEEQYGSDDDRTELQQAHMEKDTQGIPAKILELRSKVKDHEKIDIKALREKKASEEALLKTQLTTDWTRDVESALFDEFTITDTVDGKEEVLFKQKVEDDFKQTARQEVIKFLVDNKIPATKEGIQYARTQIGELYAQKNMTKILKLYGDQRANEREDALRKEYAGMDKSVSRSANSPVSLDKISKEQADRLVHGSDTQMA